jgi:D-amino-acid dehydrogenase
MILGAGMVGITAALELQKRGYSVAVIDRRGPGEETSFGNAGVIQAEAVEPYAIPRDVDVLLNYALGRTNDLVYDWRALLRTAPVLLSYFRNSAPKQHKQASALYSQLVRRSTWDHEPLIEASGQHNLVQKSGYVHAYRSEKAFEQARQRADALAKNYGVGVKIEDGEALRLSEPALRRTLAGGISWTDAWTCTDPGGLTAGYAKLFIRRGGQMVRGDALSLRKTSAGWSVDTEEGVIDAAQAVVALGPWSADLLARLGYRLRMLLKRGYHGHFDSAIALNRPLMDAENGIVLSPMSRGLRIATGAALVDRDSPPVLRQLNHGEKVAADLIELGPRIKEPQWYGHRPCLPDMLPMIGRAPKHDGLWFDLGHGHQGFTLGPTSAVLLADAMEGKSEPLLSALAPAARPSVLL